MNAVNPGRFEVPAWAWALATFAVVLILAGLISGGPSPNIERAAAKNARDISGEPSPADPSFRPPARPLVAPGAGPGTPGMMTTTSTPKQRPKDSRCASKAKPLVVTPRSMFPMGDVTQGIPDTVHPYRQPTEDFPNFGYAGKMWIFTGRFVRSEHADLVPTGFEVDNKKVMALANTAGPGKVLFVQSTQDPGRFAVYRKA